MCLYLRNDFSLTKMNNSEQATINLTTQRNAVFVADLNVHTTAQTYICSSVGTISYFRSIVLYLNTIASQTTDYSVINGFTAGIILNRWQATKTASL
jgi:hypothetical protein